MSGTRRRSRACDGGSHLAGLGRGERLRGDRRGRRYLPSLGTIRGDQGRMTSMDGDAGTLRPSVGRQRAAAVGLVAAACLSPQLGAAFAVTLFDELGPAGAAFLRLTIAAAILWA